MRKNYFGNDWVFGERYAYYLKEHCFQMATDAKACGYDVRFGKDESEFCSYYFEIVDPRRAIKAWNRRAT